jgi:hypothetical protein
MFLLTLLSRLDIHRYTYTHVLSSSRHLYIIKIVLLSLLSDPHNLIMPNTFHKKFHLQFFR